MSAQVVSPLVFCLALACQVGAEAPATAAPCLAHFGDATYRLEVAATAAARERGLMRRKQLAADAGMIFVFPDAAPRTFWMQDTPLPLDMIFVDAEQVVVGLVERAEPMTTTPRGVAAPAKYVIELNAGQARRRHIAVGARVGLDNLPAPH